MLFKRCTCTAPARCKHVYHYEIEIHRKRYRRSTKTANRAVAHRIMERRRLAILDGTDAADAPTVTLKQHCTTYCTYTSKTNRTAYKDAAVLEKLQAVVGALNLEGVTAFHIEKWKMARASEVSQSTVNRELNIVRGCFARAVEWELIEASPCTAVKRYDVDDQRVRVLDNDELRRVLQDADPTTALICRVTLECLPRLSEVLGIHRSHIGPSWVEIRRKGGLVDRCALTPALRAALLARGSGYVFGEGSTGRPPYEQKASLRIVRTLTRLGITDASHHTMRHTGVTLMLEAGVNPRVIQKLAGWSSLRMLERYGHTRDSEMQRAVAANAAHLDAVLAFPHRLPQAAVEREWPIVVSA